MIILAISTILGFATAGSLAFVIFLINEYVFHSGTRPPTGFDYLIIFGLIIFPIIGAVLGSMLGQALRAENKSPDVFVTSIYIFLPLALIVLVSTIFFLHHSISKRDSMPPAQNTLLISALEGTAWVRAESESKINELSKTITNQIIELSFPKNTNSTCEGGRSYSLKLASGMSEDGCWSVREGTDTLLLSNSVVTSFNQKLTVTPDSLSFMYAGQMLRFVRKL